MSGGGSFHHPATMSQLAWTASSAPGTQCSRPSPKLEPDTPIFLTDLPETHDHSLSVAP